jgi:hypothetical protein
LTKSGSGFDFGRFFHQKIWSPWPKDERNDGNMYVYIQMRNTEKREIIQFGKSDTFAPDFASFSNAFRFSVFFENTNDCTYMYVPTLRH